MIMSLGKFIWFCLIPSLKEISRDVFKTFFAPGDFLKSTFAFVCGIYNVYSFGFTDPHLQQLPTYILRTSIFTRTYLGLKIDKKSFRFLFQGAKDRVKVFSFYYYCNSIVAQRLSSGPFCVWCSHRGLRRRTKGCPVFGYPPHSPVIVKV